jgi:hypothetical protein
MKKILYTCLVLLLICFTAIVLAGLNLPSVSSYVLEKATGGKVVVSSARIRYNEGIITINMGNIRTKGEVDGTLKNLDVALDIRKGLYFRTISFHAFNLTVVPPGGQVKLFPYPVESFSASDGALTYEGEKFSIGELTVENLNTGKPLTLKGEIENGNWFDSLRVSAEGTYKGRESEVRGRIEATNVDVHRISSKMRGRTDIAGTFTYAKEVFRLEGPFTLAGYELKDKILRKPLLVEKSSGHLAVSYKEPAADVGITGASFQGVPFKLDLKVVGDDVVLFGLTSEFFDFDQVRSHLNLDPIVKLPLDMVNAIREGKIKAKSFLYREKKPIRAELEVKEMAIAYEGKSFENVEGTLRLDDERMDLVRMKGTFRSSRFSNVEGFLPFSERKDGKLRASYSVNLADIPFLIDTGDLKIGKGSTEGTVEVEGKESTGYRFRGTGKVWDADISWRSISASANGAYRFTGDEIFLDHLRLEHGRSGMALSGKWSKEYLAIRAKGDIDMVDVKPFISFPFHVEGTVGLDMDVRKTVDILHSSGSLFMDRLFVDVPGFMRKQKGVESYADLAFTARKDDIVIEHFLLKLDAINLRLKGNIKGLRDVDLDMAMDVAGIDRVAGLFLIDEGTAKGNVAMKMEVRGLTLPIKRLPHMKGYVRINNGFLRIPHLPKPLTQINLISDFKGEAFDIVLNRMACGKTLLSDGGVHVEGLDEPRFSIRLNMESFSLDDFRDSGEFLIPSISDQSILSRAKGDFSLTAKQADLNGIGSVNVKAKGSFSERVLELSELKGEIFGGSAGASGRIEIAHTPPRISTSFRLNQITAGLFLKSLGGLPEITEGRTNIYARMKSEGWTTRELMGMAEGEAVFLSTDGVIKKWNLLSKIFGLLNIYDLLRGKVDLTKQGLQYNKMGASFTVKEGVFRTSNFLIDSQSMLITGDGVVDTGKNEIHGDIAVSPLVSLDTVIGKIPVLRNILKDEGKGFLYAAYKVSGPIDDPAISTSFVNSIGGKTLEILRNILVLPKEMLGQ